MPSNQSPLGALPRRFRRERLLIVGCGDVGQRVAALVRRSSEGHGPRVLALTSSLARVPVLRAQGITPLVGNLDAPRSLRRLSGLATRVLHLAPPPTQPPALEQDPRTLAMVRALWLRSRPVALVYGSTSAVYGDLQGAVARECMPTRATSPRARRRAHAEGLLRWWARASGVRCNLLRIPGIYGVDREGGTPRERLLKKLPVLRREDDVFTNHIEANDLARACAAALYRGRAQRAYNVNDNTELLMGDYFDTAADLMNLPRPPRVSRQQAAQQLTAMQMSFMSESRRMDNTRLRKELRVLLRYPTIEQGLRRA